ncbi:hypothetical protein Tco_0043733 [Tanacetum coccineum]
MDERASYRISNFGIGENSGNFPLLEHRFKLNFFKNTALTRIESFDSNPRGFRFEHFGAFTSRKFFERELSDVIGTIVSISDSIPFNYAGVDKIRRTVILEDYDCARKRYSEKEGFDPENHSIVMIFLEGASKRWWVIYEILIVYVPLPPLLSLLFNACYLLTTIEINHVL